MEKPEIRYIDFTGEVRSVSDENKEKVLKLKIASFNSTTRIGKWFQERIDPGFFDPILNDPDSDVVALFNHDPNFVLGRRSNSKLTLSKTEDGLYADIILPNNTTGNDLYESIKRGDIKGCSFSFEVAEERWDFDDDPKNDLRTLMKASKIWDVGPVTFPAYQETSADVKRSRPEKKEDKPSVEKLYRQRQLELNNN